METVLVKPELIRWARKRSGLTVDALQLKFPKFQLWERGEAQPTLRQLENIAKATFTPLGYFFLPSPPVETLSIPDFRTVGDVSIARPSPNLIDTLHDMQRRQDWMRDEVIENGQDKLNFVGSGKGLSVLELAGKIRETLGLSDGWSERCTAWEEALRELRNAVERLRILVAITGVVGLNNRRSLDPQEFRGFVLCDDYAPLIFVNGADSKSAQMFTLAHELAHLWLGEDGLFNLIGTFPSSDATEKLCNKVAAEFLVPGTKLKNRWNDAKVTPKPFHTVARWFKVSPIVAARRALDLGLIDKAVFFDFYNREQEEWRLRKNKDKEDKEGGPNFYVVQDVRLGRLFATAVTRATREGRLPYLEAYRLTGLKGDTFDKYGDILLRRLKDEHR